MSARTGQRGRRRLRLVRSVAALGHELVELRLVLGAAQPLQIVDELLLLLFQPAQRLGAVVVEGGVAAAGGARSPLAAARRRTSRRGRLGMLCHRPAPFGPQARSRPLNTRKASIAKPSGQNTQKARIMAAIQPPRPNSSIFAASTMRPSQVNVNGIYILGTRPGAVKPPVQRRSGSAGAGRATAGRSAAPPPAVPRAPSAAARLCADEQRGDAVRHRPDMQRHHQRRRAAAGGGGAGRLGGAAQHRRRRDRRPARSAGSSSSGTPDSNMTA